MVIAERLVDSQVNAPTPEDKLLKAIYILEHGDINYNLIDKYFHVPDNNYCVQGLLLELSGTGYWHQQSDYEWSNRYKFHGEDDKEFCSKFSYSGFIRHYYSLGIDNSLIVDRDKLPIETRNYYNEILKCIPASDRRISLAAVNNTGVSSRHPKIRQVLADILRYKAFIS